MRGTRHASADGQPVHLLAALDQRCGVVLGQVRVDGKTNEITRFAPLLEPVYAITSLDVHQATPAQLAAWIRGHWQIEALHYLRDVSYGEASQIRTGSGPQAMAALLAIGILKTAGHASTAAACRHHARDATRTLETLGLRPA